MVKLIDGKYQIIAPHADDIRIINELSQAIPEDEPMILFRARDRHALTILHYYLEVCKQDDCNSRHIVGIQKRIAAFGEFAREHRERMKQPGIMEGK